MSDLQSTSGSATRIDLAQEGEFALGPHLVVPSTLEVRRGGHAETLQPRVMQVLVALARRRGEVVSRTELVASCWEGLNVGDDAINRCLSKLRRVAEAPGGPTLAIETIPRVGYRLTVTSASAAPSDAPQPAASDNSLPAFNFERHWIIGLGAALVVVVAALLGLWWLRPPEAVVRIAVPPAEIVGADPALRAFADAVRAEIVSLLGNGDAAGTLVAQGDATLILRSRAENDGKMLRLTTTIERDGAALWSRTFSGDSGTGEMLKREASGKAADMMQTALLCDGIRGPADTVSLCLRAFDLARDSDLPRARILFAELATKAPASGLAHVMLASVAAGEATIMRGAPRQRLMAQAHSEAERALALDPALADAYRVLAATLPTAAWSEREALLRRAAGATPAVSLWKSNVSSGLGRFMLEAGRTSEAASFVQEATTLDPLSASKVTLAAATLEAANRNGEAMALLARAASSWPHSYAILFVQRRLLVLYGSQAEAMKALADTADALPLEPAAREALERFIAARSLPEPSRVAEARVSLSAAADAGTLDRRLVVGALAELGALDEAFAQADRLYGDEHADTSILFVPATAAMRKDERFTGLLQRVGLVAYSRKTNVAPDYCRESETACSWRNAPGKP